MQRINVLKRQFNWRMLLMRIVVNALALLITAVVVPTINFQQKTLLAWFLLAVLLGVFNAVIKPVIQFATLRFIFATYGLIVVLINSVVLILMSWLFPELIEVGNLFWALVAGALIGVVSAFFENVLGLTPPIVSEKHPEIRRRIRERETTSVKAHISQTAAEIMLPAEVTVQPDAAADAAAVLAVVGAEPSAATDTQVAGSAVNQEA